MINFFELENKYGPALAYQCLVEIERAANIPAWTVLGVDHETRLANAIRLQDEAANDNDQRIVF